MKNIVILTIFSLGLFIIAPTSTFAIAYIQQEIVGDNQWSWSTHSGDIDGDGDIDIVVANVSGGNRLWINDGEGNFTSKVIPSFGAAQALQIVDMNGDGHMDILSSRSSGTNSLRIFINNGLSGDDLAFSIVNVIPGLGSLYEAAVADFNDDGHLDIYVTDQGGGGGTNRLLINNGANVWTESNIPGDTAPSISVEVADFNGDGHLDIYTPSYIAGQNRLWINDGLGNGGTSFTSADIVGDAGISYQSFAIDIDDDGDIDLWTLDTTGQNKLFLNDGNASFTESNIPGDTNGISGAVFDYDDDGDLDFYVGIYGVQSKLWINDGEGNGGDSFTLDQVDGDAYQTLGVTVNDFNGDGYLDIYTANYSGQQNYLWMWDTSVVIEPEEPSSSSSSSRRSSVILVCKDPNASNYTNTRFGRHHDRVCNYESKPALCSDRIIGFYRLGDIGERVRVVQSFLSDQLNMDLSMDGIFGPLTHNAVVLFQEMHRDDILLPLSLDQGTGYWHVYTSKKANELLCE